MHRHVLFVLTVGLLAAIFGPATAKAVTDEDVVKALDKAQAYLIGLQQPDGAWPEQGGGLAGSYGQSEMALFTLAYIGVHPNRDVMTKALDTVLLRPLQHTYAVSMRAMALAILQKKLASDKRDTMRQAMNADAVWLETAQGSHGGWDYGSLSGGGGRFDLSNTQMAILALRELALAGHETPILIWQRAQALYFKLQQQDGGWNYGAGGINIGECPSYGSMTAAGLASLFITSDNLEPGRGCPCRSGKSTLAGGDLDRRVDSALGWLEKNFLPDANPRVPDNPGTQWQRFYWLYAVERVSIASGYKYFGTRNWYKEGAEILLKIQAANGSWGNLPDTCFAILFLYKGRAPVLYNKLQFKGEWNNHRRDIANLTDYIERTKEQMFHWQIVGLQAPVEELHDAPILYITAETVPEFTAEEEQKLRAFTDTGGTILFEASCGNPVVRAWFKDFVQKVWPEWTLKPIGPEHGSFLDPYALKQRPEILGLDDGLRTFLFYAMDDISCPWNTRAFTAKEYLFKWGINLYTYATDQSPLRAKLAAREPATSERYATPIKGGPKNALRLARLKYDGPWTTAKHYRPFERLTKTLADKATVTLNVEDEGVAAPDLGDRDVAYLVGAGAQLTLSEADREALKAYLAKGGFLWVESAGGSNDFDKAVRKLAEDAGWELKPIDKTHPLVTGQFSTAIGYNVSSGVEFRRALRVVRLGRTYAEWMGIYQNGQLVGLYSPFDVMFSLLGYNAYNCRGYKSEDALAVATNLVLYLTDRSAAATPATPPAATPATPPAATPATPPAAAPPTAP